jgi:hypothetical protein
MLTARDLAKRYGVTLHDIAEWNLYKVLPGPVKVGGQLRWREDDIRLFDEYLEALLEFEANTGDESYPADAPAPPVYSTGRPAYDPRETMARLRERERHERSKTLSAGSVPPPAEEPLKMPAAPGVTQRESD